MFSFNSLKSLFPATSGFKANFSNDLEFEAVNP